ncbi:MAG: mechanosensitive ion channel family protein [Bacteroidales bacterium]|nr:mechanosensitive ion channel family protein [Bacteroidales bacterium]
MKKIFVFVLLCVLTIFQAQAVLKEKDLFQTLGVLRSELQQAYNEQQMMMARFEKRNMDQHTRLIQIMQQSNQIALMLYSQNADFTFDMTYACQAATEQYHKLKSYHAPYNKIIERLNAEIERYDALIQTLKRLPPRMMSDSDFVQIPDSIRQRLPKMMLDTTGKNLYILDKQGLEDRAACVEYATALRDNYKKMLENVEMDQEHYERVTKRVEKLNAYALSKYEHIQKNIFVNGGENYFQTIKRFRMHYLIAKKDVDDKYKPFKRNSEWRGPVILGISIFMLFYIMVASLLSYVIMRWLLPRKWRIFFADNKKRPFITIACGVAIFAISITIAKFFVTQNFVLMAIRLMILYAWLVEVILVSLLIRLSSDQIRAGVRSYTPFLVMAFIVIVFRIILIPNNLVNLIYPPILLVFTFLQFFVIKRKITKLPDSDMVYTVISLIVMIVSCVAAWFGFVLLAVQIMVWWALQLAAIQTITCFYDLAKMYESHRLPKKIARKQGETIDNKEELEKQFKKLQPKMIKGEYIGQTWFYDFLFKALLPILAILSVPFCVYWAADIFEMAPVCRKIFQYVFLNKPGIIQLSLYKICLTLELFFLFRYLNYAIRAFYQMLKKRRKKNEIRSQGNSTLAYNVISILVWGLYVLLCMMILEVSGKGISIVMAGLATGLGFAMKDLLENFIYGITLMTGRLRVGDYIECDGVQGKVDSINYQSTQLVTLDGSVIAFQNATLFSKNFKNLTRNHGYVLVKIPVGVAYGVNVENVRKMLLRDLQPLITKNSAGKYLVDNKQGFQVVFDDFGESSVDLYVVCWVLVEEKAAFIAKVKEVIYNTLNKNKIEIPFPQRDVYVRHVEMPSAKTKAKKAEASIPETTPEVNDTTSPAEKKTDAPKKRGRKPKKQVETNQNVNNDKQSV